MSCHQSSVKNQSKRVYLILSYMCPHHLNIKRRGFEIKGNGWDESVIQWERVG